MHPNPAFRRTGTDASLALLRERAFGVLAISAEGAPLLSHVPFLLSGDATHADLHLVRSNPICRAAGEGIVARLAVSGPDGYISPDWYGAPEQVPTWNYVAVHLTGTLRPLPPETLPDLLARQSAAYEARLPKKPWSMDKVPEDTQAKLLRMILPYRLEIESLDSTWKLGQNKPDAARLGAAEALQTGFGHELAELAALTRKPPADAS